MLFFDAYGPFEISHPARKISSSQLAMWKDVRTKSEHYEYETAALEKAIGVYVFGLKWGSTLTPWYVGQTMAEAGFRGEVFQQHKLDKYNDVIRKRRGTPVMFLFPLLTPDDRMSKNRSPFNKRLIAWTEQMLFGLALAKNPDCMNLRDTKFLKECGVNGVFGPTEPGRPEKMAADAKRLLFR